MTPTSAIATVTRNSAVNAPGPTTLATSAVMASATAAPSDSPIVRAALLKPCAACGDCSSTDTENRGYMKPMAAPQSVHATNATAGASPNATTASTATSDSASTTAPIRTT